MPDKKKVVGDGGVAEAQRLADEANAKGYIGEIAEPDGDKFTVAGVTSKMSDEERERPVAAPLSAGDRSGQTQGSSGGPTKTNEPDGTDTGK